MLASSGSNYDRAIKIWNLESGECIASFKHSSGVKSCLLFSPDGRTLYSDGWFSVDAWDVARRQNVRSIYKGRANQFALLRDGRLIAGSYYYVRLWDVMPTPALVSLGERSGRSVAYQPQGHYLATSREDGAVQLRDPQTGRIEREFVPDGPPYVPDDKLYRIRTLCFNPSGDTLCSAARDGTVRQWDVATGRCKATIPAVHNITHQSVAFSPDGRYWAYAQR